MDVSDLRQVTTETVEKYLRRLYLLGRAVSTRRKHQYALPVLLRLGISARHRADRSDEGDPRPPTEIRLSQKKLYLEKATVRKMGRRDTTPICLRPRMTK
jgi:hypothetical protein